MLLPVIHFLLSVHPVCGQWAPDGIPVTAATGDQESHVVVLDGTGGGIVAWRDVRSGEYDIYAQRVNDLGEMQWTPDGIPVCTAAGSQEFPVIVNDDAGGAIIFWTDSRNGAECDVYAQRVDGSGTPQWLPDGIPVCTNSGYQSAGCAASDGAGGAIVAWSDAPAPAANTSIYAQRVSSTGSLLWTVGGDTVSVTAYHERPIFMVSDGLGGAFISFIRMSLCDSPRIQHVNSSGEIWRTAINGYENPIALDRGSGAGIVGDGQGGIVAGWARENSQCITFAVYAQRVDAARNIHWTAGGNPVCTADGRKIDVFLAEDGAGGAILVWEDWRTYPDTAVYAQRVDPSGTTLWATDGIILSPSWGAGQTITPDGAGGAIVACSVIGEDGVGDISAQRVDPSGNLLWAADGVPVCRAPGWQRRPVIVGSRIGEGIVIWEDERDGLSNCDIYAQMVLAGGEVAAVLQGDQVGFLQWLDQNTPNPFNPRTTIRYRLTERARVSLEVFNVAGRLVRSLTINDLTDTGEHEAVWLGRDKNGRQMPSGTYFYRLTVGDYMETKRMTLVR
jgi:hypothetical protein